MMTSPHGEVLIIFRPNSSCKGSPKGAIYHSVIYCNAGYMLEIWKQLEKFHILSALGV